MDHETTYLFLWGLTFISYFLPWISINQEMYSGFELASSFTYLVGLAFGLVVLYTKLNPVTLTIVAGILMFIGVLAAPLSIPSYYLSHYPIRFRSGYLLSLALSIIYTTIGTKIGKNLEKE